MANVGRKPRHGKHGHDGECCACAHGFGELRSCKPWASGWLNRFDNHDSLPQAVRANANNGGTAHGRDALDILLRTDRRNGTRRRHNHVRQPAFDPQPAEVVKVADIARAMPPRARCIRLEPGLTNGRTIC